MAAPSEVRGAAEMMPKLWSVCKALFGIGLCLSTVAATESLPVEEGADETDTTLSSEATSPKAESKITKESWHLSIGQSRSLHVQPGSHLRFSRRGVVDPIQTGEQDWTLIGLQKGVVSLVVQETATGSTPRASRSILIEVSQPNIQQGPLSATEWPPHPLCASSPEVRCDKVTKTVAGQLSRWQSYLDLKRACSNQTPCWFSATLTAEAKSEWDKVIHERLAPVTRFELRSDGILILWRDCIPGHTEDRDAFVLALAERLYPRQDIFQRCNGDGPKDSYLFKAKVYLADENALREWGLDPLFNGKSLAQVNNSSNLSALTLHDLESSKSATLIAQPTLLINTQSQVAILSGGEVQAASQLAQHASTDAEHLFKKVGLELKVLVNRIASGLLRVNYQVSLSSHTNPGSGPINLASTAFAGELDLPIGTPTVIGGTQFNSEGSTASGSLLLSKVPILGPLFAIAQNEKINRLALLWLQLCPPPLGREEAFRFPASDRGTSQRHIQETLKEDCTNKHDPSSFD